MHFHLHITVEPHWSWSHADLAEALTQDVARHGMKPLVITNHFKNPVRKSYKELIPTKEIEADCEADASREIFRMGILLNNSGWRVKRLKIEGDPRSPEVQRRAIYFECHLKNANPAPKFVPVSTTAKGNTFHTLRKRHVIDLHTALDSIYCPLLGNEMEKHRVEIEAAILDTNPQLDDEWINQ